jgi:hypothetical protein
MKKWWQRWTYEVPLAVGDALWEVLVVQFAAFLDRLTLRKIIEFVIIALLVMAFIQTLPIDLAILFAGDTLLYLEFAVAVRLAAGRIHLKQALRFALQLAKTALRASASVRTRPLLRVNRWREQRRDATQATSRKPSDSSEDEPGMAWGAFAMA